MRCARIGARNKGFATGLGGLGLPSDCHGFGRKGKTRAEGAESIANWRAVSTNSSDCFGRLECDRPPESAEAVVVSDEIVVQLGGVDARALVVNRRIGRLMLAGRGSFGFSIWLAPCCSPSSPPAGQSALLAGILRPWRHQFAARVAISTRDAGGNHSPFADSFAYRRPPPPRRAPRLLRTAHSSVGRV